MSSCSSAPAPLSLLSTPALPVKMVWLKMKEPVKPAPTAPVTMLLMPAGASGEQGGSARVSEERAEGIVFVFVFDKASAAMLLPLRPSKDLSVSQH